MRRSVRSGYQQLVRALFLAIGLQATVGIALTATMPAAGATTLPLVRLIRPLQAILATLMLPHGLGPPALDQVGPPVWCPQREIPATIPLTPLDVSPTGQFSPEFNHYLEDITAITGLPLPAHQVTELRLALATTAFQRVSAQENKRIRHEFSRQKRALIAEWEAETLRVWPTHSSEILSKKGILVRYAGQRYDAHHIIETSFGGCNEWWNLHPARYPDQHQLGIHRRGGAGAAVFRGKRYQPPAADHELRPAA